MGKPKKIQVSEKYGEYELDFYGLVDVVEKYRQLEEPRFDFYSEYDYSCVVFSGWRPENDEERKKRLADNKKEKLKRLQEKVLVENKEKQELDRLLLKYQGITLEELNDWPT